MQTVTLEKADNGIKSTMRFKARSSRHAAEIASWGLEMGWSAYLEV